MLPKFMADNPELTAKWDVVFGARGNFHEPYGGCSFGLGTLEVRAYLASLHEPRHIAAFLKSAGIEFRGPSGNFGGLLFIEKEGFSRLLAAAHIAEEFDIATMSTKGTSVTAARYLADMICDAYDIPLLIARDLDKTGFSISGTLQRDTWRYEFENQIKVIELGLSLDDVEQMKLEFEYQFHEKGDKEKMIANLRENDASEAVIDFMFQDFDSFRHRRCTRRVELNAMTSPQFVAFLKRKLKHVGIKKIVPGKSDLGNAYRLFARGREAERIVKPVLKKLEDFNVTVPRDLEQQVRSYLRKNPAQRWDAAVAAVVKVTKK
jgi:Topoisomerase 6 subunit A/Spo11, Toprim domain